jgi:hypothetical protein
MFDMCLCDFLGSFIVARADYISFYLSIVEGEALGLFKALRWVRGKGGNRSGWPDLFIKKVRLMFLTRSV